MGKEKERLSQSWRRKILG